MFLPEKGQTHSLDYYSHCSPKTPYEKYASRAAVITEAIASHQYYTNEVTLGTDLVVQMQDTGEMVPICTTFYGNAFFGFVSEMESAKAMVGTTMWSKFDPALLQNGQAIHVDQISKLVLSRVDWGILEGDEFRRTPITLRFKAESGEEGVSRLKCAFLEKFTVWTAARADYIGYRPMCTEYFYKDDPRSLFKDWSPEIWDLVKRGQVRLGMTSEQAEVACGGRFRTQEISASLFGNAVGTQIVAYPDREISGSGCNKTLLIKNDKVTKIGF